MSRRIDTVADAPLTRVTEVIYRHLALGLSLALACLPTVIVQMLFRSDLSNIPVFVGALLPVAPALSAGLYTVRSWRQASDGGPFAMFLKGYLLNVRDVLKWWVPVVLAGIVLSINIVFADAVFAGPALRGVSIVCAVLSVLWSGHALVISSFFSFRTRDVARIATVELLSRWRVSLAFVSLAVVAIALVYFGTEIALLVLAWAFVVMIELVSRPVVNAVTVRFTAGE
jgi:Protein of unknown function, DUF624